MKLITKEIEKKLLATPVNSTRDKSPEDIPVIVKFFGGGQYSCFVYEGDKLENGDWLFSIFGCMHENEFGSILLSELETVHFPPFGLPIERDMDLPKMTLDDVLAEYGSSHYKFNGARPMNEQKIKPNSND